MLRAPLLTAVRRLRRRPGYAALNVVGLAVGLACVVLIGLYVRDELLYDRFHPSADRIVRLDADLVSEGSVEPYVETPGLLAPALEADLPAVEHAVRLTGGASVFRVGERRFHEDDVLYADTSFFHVFDGFRLLEGSPETALAAPGSVVLTETLARRYFDGADPLGQTVLAGSQPLTVTGVMADVPRQSHLQFSGLISLSTAEDPGWYYQNWLSVNFLTYARLRPEADVAAFQAALPGLVQRRAGAELEEENRGVVLHAVPLPDLHLHADRGEHGSPTTLLALVSIAALVLLVAGVNYVNLSTARSLDRAKEVGVRKSLGAGRGGVAAGFLAEAVVLSLLALIVALGLVALARPAFETLSGKEFTLGSLLPWLPALVGLAVATGLLAGAYPALTLSGFHPAAALRGRFATGGRGVGVRQGLVVLQLAIAVALLAGTAVVYAQVRYMLDKDLGFSAGDENTQLLTLDLGSEEAAPERLGPIRERMAAVPGVVGVASSLTVPVGSHPEGGGSVERPDGTRQDFSVEAYLVDTSFVSVYGLHLLAGRPPGAETSGDSTASFVVNETAAREAGYPSPESMIGRRLSFWGFEGDVVGVVRDFHTRGLQEQVGPLALVATDEYQSVLTLRVQTADLPRTLAALEDTWADVAPERPFEYGFIDEAFGAQYAAERRFGGVFGLFAGLAVLVAGLGLFGLAAYTAQQRTKEIGIRKALGATTAGLVVLLTRDTVRLAALGFALAVPAVYLVMSRWLDGFAYRTPLGPGVFLAAGLVVLLVALLTVSGMALRAASADPVKALRSE